MAALPPLPEAAVAPAPAALGCPLLPPTPEIPPLLGEELGELHASAKQALATYTAVRVMTNDCMRSLSRVDAVFHSAVVFYKQQKPRKRFPGLPSFGAKVADARFLRPAGADRRNSAPDW
jgi:hypothetical protein